MDRLLQTLLMSLILPAVAFLAIVFYEIFSKDPMGHEPYSARPSDHARKGQFPQKRRR